MTKRSDIDLRGIIDLLRRQARVILITVVAVLALAALVTVALKPVFTASGLVLVDPSGKNLLDPSSQATSGSSDSSRVDGEVEIVTSDATLLQVIKELNLVSDPEFGVKLGLVRSLLAWLRMGDTSLPTGEEALSEVLLNLRRSVGAQRVGLTFLIEISARSRDGARAAEIANAVTRAYLRNQIDAKIRSTLEALDILGERLKDASDAVVRSEGAFDNFLAQNVTTIVSRTGRLDIADLQNQLVTSETERVRLKGLADSVSQTAAQQEWGSIADLLGSEAIRALEAQRRQLAGSIEQSSADPPTVEQLRKQLKEIEDRLAQASQRELSGLQSSISKAQSRESELRDQLRSSVLTSDLPADLLAQVYEIQQASEVARTQYQTLLVRQNDLQTQAALQVADSRTVSDALPQSRPSFPNVPLALSVAAIAALGLGLALAVLYENYIGGFVSERQLESVLKLRVLATIPRIRVSQEGDGSKRGSSAANTIVVAPTSQYGEAIRSTRVAIDQILRARRADKGTGVVVMVASALPNEGKTTVALSLARAFALGGRRTLLIDCDLRRPAVAQQAGLEPAVPLADLLSGAVGPERLQDVVQQDPVTPLQLLLGARRGTEVDDHAWERTLNVVIAWARREFDVVLLDTPPAGIVADAQWISGFADIVLMVIRWATTSQQEAHRALQKVLDAKRHDTEVVAVLNSKNITSRAGSSYSSYYDAR